MVEDRYEKLMEIAGISKEKEKEKKIRKIREEIKSLYEAIHLAITTDKEKYYNHYYSSVGLEHIEHDFGKHFTYELSLKIRKMREDLNLLLNDGIINDLDYINLNYEIDKLVYEAIAKAMERYFIGKNSELVTSFRICEEEYIKNVRGIPYYLGYKLSRWLKKLLGRKFREKNSSICDCIRSEIKNYEEMMNYLFEGLYSNIVDVGLKMDASIMFGRAIYTYNENVPPKCGGGFSEIKKKIQNEAINIIEKYEEKLLNRKEEYLKNT